MKQLWAPWRMTYINQISKAEGCIFCQKMQEKDAREALVLARTGYSVVMLNKYPYANGHLLLAPKRHEKHLSRRDSEVIINAIFDSMVDALAQGDRIEIRGFGSFVVKHRRARQGRNPKSGVLVSVAAKRVPFFKVGNELRLRVDGKDPGTEEAASE